MWCHATLYRYSLDQTKGDSQSRGSKYCFLKCNCDLMFSKGITNVLIASVVHLVGVIIAFIKDFIKKKVLNSVQFHKQCITKL